MIENNWKSLWSGRSADESILQDGDPQKIFMELKRSNGFDVVKDQLTYESFLEQHREIRRRLFLNVPSGVIRSVYEVGCGSGANLFLFESDGMDCGGTDYSPKLLEGAKKVLHTTDIRCAEAAELPTEPKYDAVISVGVFPYFIDEAYAETVLEKMYQKARYTMGIVDISDAEKRDAYTAYRKRVIPNFEERYRGLPRLFFSREFFIEFARSHNMDIEFSPVNLPGYWNSQFCFDCYLYKR